MNVVLFDNDQVWRNLLPLTFTRPVSEIRVGILTIKQKWDKYFNTNCSYLTKPYLATKFKINNQPNSLFIDSSVCPDHQLIDALTALKTGQALYHQGNDVIAYKGGVNDKISELIKTDYSHPVFKLTNVWDVFQKNAEAITADFGFLTHNAQSQPLSSTVTVIGNRNLVFLEKGAKAEACVLNTQGGPIYVGEGAEIMEGSVVRGPLALCEHSALKLSAKIYGATTIGPHCKIGGEVNNSVIFGYSNKAHDGFLGNSVVGEWCNLGADTNNSNLKNNYGNVKLFNYIQNKAVDTGLQFCGLVMADHSKSGINTMFNTGTVVGVGANIFGGGFPPTHIPSFSWGGSQGLEPYKLEKLFETAERVYGRRGLEFTVADKEILVSIQSGSIL